MRRFSLAGLLVAATTAGACSLINAPAEVIPGSGGAGGGASTTGTSTGNGGGCTKSTDCAGLTDACGVGVCTNGMCTKDADPTKDGLPCDDGLFCTVTDVCTAGTCVGAARTCPEAMGSGGGTGTSGTGTSGTGTSGTSASGTGGSGTGGSGSSSSGAGGGGPTPDACHVWACVESAKQCEIVLGAVGSTCDDGEPCTTGETCAADGTCGNGLPTNCKALDSECSVGECQMGVGCAPTPLFEGFICNALNPCGASICTAGKCTLVTAKNTGMPCDDKLYCTKEDTCQPNGTCGGAPTCTDPTPCIVASCNEVAQTCAFAGKAAGEPCATSACSAGQTCNVAGSCVGGTAAATYFYENFANNNKGWLLGPEWQIGAATASPSGSAFGSDPDNDNTPNTNDKGVAGVVIGGNENPTIHPMYYIESPTIDISAAQGQLYLTYYRWLNSDYLPYMKNAVEVYDGTQWVEIWASGMSPGIQDSPPVGLGWTFMSHDITAYKNAGIKVRFGFDVESGGVYTIGSWNLDDVKLQNTACTTVP